MTWQRGDEKATPAPRRRGWLWPALGALALVAGGCASSELETSYGRQRPWLTDASVNGTDVLAGMFTAAGHEVHSRGVLLTTAMQSVDTIVWFPNDYAAPNAEVCEWFDQWLSEGTGRTLVFVGRDYDAAPIYWRKATPLAPPEERQAFRDRAVAAAVCAAARPKIDDEDLQCEWFKIEPVENQEPVDQLAGPWSQGVAADQTEIELGTQLVPNLRVRRQLTAGDDLLVARIRERQWNGSQLILVANGSFLLNLPLVNREHRKLAGKLIAQAGTGRVVFLESGPGGPPIDPPQADNSLWSVFGVWPLNVILLHSAVLGLIFCFARWPIFGRPRVPPAPAISDFSKHVEAMGELLRRTKDRPYALAKLAEIDGAPLAHLPKGTP